MITFVFFSLPFWPAFRLALHALFWKVDYRKQRTLHHASLRKWKQRGTQVDKPFFCFVGKPSKATSSNDNFNLLDFRREPFRLPGSAFKTTLQGLLYSRFPGQPIPQDLPCL